MKAVVRRIMESIERNDGMLSPSILNDTIKIMNNIIETDTAHDLQPGVMRRLESVLMVIGPHSQLEDKDPIYLGIKMLLAGEDLEIDPVKAKGVNVKTLTHADIMDHSVRLSAGGSANSMRVGKLLKVMSRKGDETIVSTLNMGDYTAVTATLFIPGKMPHSTCGVYMTDSDMLLNELTVVYNTLTACRLK